MRKNCFIVGEALASQVTCTLSTVNGQCFIRKSMLDKVHVICWDEYVKSLGLDLKHPKEELWKLK